MGAAQLGGVRLQSLKGIHRNRPRRDTKDGHERRRRPMRLNHREHRDRDEQVNVSVLPVVQLNLFYRSPCFASLQKRFSRLGKRSPRLGDRSPRLGKRSPRLGKRSPRLGKRSPRLGERSPRLGERSPRLGERPRRLGERPQRLLERPRSLRERSRSLRERSRSLRERSRRRLERSRRLLERSRSLRERSPNATECPCAGGACVFCDRGRVFMGGARRIALRRRNDESIWGITNSRNSNSRIKFE